MRKPAKKGRTTTLQNDKALAPGPEFCNIGIVTSALPQKFLVLKARFGGFSLF
jgi:hypothetical protein